MFTVLLSCLSTGNIKQTTGPKIPCEWVTLDSSQGYKILKIKRSDSSVETLAIKKQMIDSYSFSVVFRGKREAMTGKVKGNLDSTTVVVYDHINKAEDSVEITVNKIIAPTIEYELNLMQGKTIIQKSSKSCIPYLVLRTDTVSYRHGKYGVMVIRREKGKPTKMIGPMILKLE